MTDRVNKRFNRRELLKSTTVAVGTMAAAKPALAAETSTRRVGKPTVCLFSKPLHNRPVAELPPLLPRLGVDAVDLTCRPGGHVLPERVADELPLAHELLKAAGITIPMITTGITDADKGNAEAIIKSAASLGIRYAKLGYYSYGDLHKIHATLADVKARLRDVAAMCKQYGVQAGFHNHAGNMVGAVLWDVWHLINGLPAEAIGSYFDLRHATVEGGQNGWRIGMNLLAPRIVMVAVKDFVWHKDPGRGWQVRNVPLGEGMVRCEEAFRWFRGQSFAGPISLHMEYGQHLPPVASEPDKVNLAAIGNDWAHLRDVLARVGLK